MPRRRQRRRPLPWSLLLLTMAGNTKEQYQLYGSFILPVAAKICESSTKFHRILTQCIPTYQSGMVIISGGTVQEHEHDTFSISNPI